MRSFFPGLELKAVRETRSGKTLPAELAERGISDKIPPKLFEKVFIDLQKGIGIPEPDTA